MKLIAKAASTSPRSSSSRSRAKAATIISAANGSRRLRRICDENDMLLIFDEVQTGMGTTGRNWCCEHFGVMPDLLAFGKKTQVCGVMAGPRLDEVKDNCFRLPGRINSTWGGNFTDYGPLDALSCASSSRRTWSRMRAAMGDRFFLIADRTRAKPLITAVRGRGLILAFDLPDPETRDDSGRVCYERRLSGPESGERSIRFRPVLDISAEVDGLKRSRFAAATDSARRLTQASCHAATVLLKTRPQRINPGVFAANGAGGGKTLKKFARSTAGAGARPRPPRGRLRAGRRRAQEAF